MTGTRSDNGRFTTGNPGGPGRPRRAIESDYLKAFSDAVSLDAWRTIVSRAVADAQAGDARARDWVARYALGSEPSSLVSIAATEERAANESEEIEDEVSREVVRQRFKQQDEENWRESRAVLAAIRGRLPK